MHAEWRVGESFQSQHFFATLNAKIEVNEFQLFYRRFNGDSGSFDT